MNILNKLTIKHLKMNKKRTIVTIVGVILSTALMVGIGLLLSTFREVMIDEAIASSGDYHAKLLNVSSNNYNTIIKNNNIEKTYAKEFIGYSKIDTNDDFKRYFSVFYANKDYLNHLELVSGSMPKSDSEIVIPEDSKTTLKVGDKITLNVGNRYLDGQVNNSNYYSKGEIIKDYFTKEYTVVGIIKKDVYESYSEVGFNVFTYKEKLDNQMLYIIYKNPKKTIELTEKIAKNFSVEEYDLNTSLLSLYGVSKYGNIMRSIVGLLVIMLLLVSVGCIIVIYNSFAISVMERKKQFGLFASIGATRKQLRKTVLFESFIVGIIGIPLGILSAYIGIGAVVASMNILLKDLPNTAFKLVTYPIFIIVPIIFMIITIIISAFIPAIRASRISPIEAIRLNDDIKIKGRKVKTSKLTRKLFGIEGELALKNIKRNKKKYRITIISLFISILLFISFSSYMNYAMSSMDNDLAMPSFDIVLNNVSLTKDKNIINKVINSKYVDEYAIMRSETYLSKYKVSEMNLYNDKYIKFLKENKMYYADNNEYINLIVFDDETFKDYIKGIGNTMKPVLFDKAKGFIYKERTRKGYQMNMFNNSHEEIPICKTEDANSCIYTLKDYYISDKEYIGIRDMYNNLGITIIMPRSYYLEHITDTYESYEVVLKSNDVKELDSLIEELLKNNTTSMSSYNISKEYQMMNNLIIVIKILVYGFIALVTLIGVTSVFNTINTSINLRRKEFAVLRSIGLTPKGFNKMLRYESIIYGLKSLLYAIPMSLLVTYLIHKQVSDYSSIEHIIIPYKAILIAVIGVFIIVAITMRYSSRKIKNENIIDTIREENI